LLTVWGRQDPHVPLNGRNLIRVRLEEVEANFQWHEVNGQHAFMRDEGPRYDPALAYHCYGLVFELFHRRLPRATSPTKTPYALSRANIRRTRPRSREGWGPNRRRSEPSPGQICKTTQYLEVVYVGARIGAKNTPHYGGEGNMLFAFSGRATRNFLALLVMTHFILFVDRVNLAARPE
jgi:hypothetical protein